MERFKRKHSTLLVITIVIVVAIIGGIYDRDTNAIFHQESKLSEVEPFESKNNLNNLNQENNEEDSIFKNLKKISLKSKIDIVQPMTGIALWESSWNDKSTKTKEGNIQLEYAYIKYNDIVEDKGIYDWSSVEELLNRIKNRKHQAILRLYYTYPGQYTTVPWYIKDLEDYEELTGISEGKSTEFPDWRHEELKKFTIEFFTEFAKKYDNDPRLAFLQVGFGLWGEYHIYDGTFELGRNFPDKEFQKKFFNHLNGSFKNLKWMISVDASKNKYSPFEEDKELLKSRFGIFDDSFMQINHHEENEKWWNFFNYKERYKTQPNGGELSYYEDYDQEHVLDVSGIYGNTYGEFSEKFNVTFMIGNDQPKYQDDITIKEAGMKNGYKFKITSFESSKEFSKVVVKNTGIAPIYYDAYINVNGVNSDKSLKNLLPGETKDYIVKVGGENPKLTITCVRLIHGQVIQYEADI